MPTTLKFRRGTSTQNDTFTGAEGEVTVDTTNKTLRVHDGSTAGGIKLAKNSERDDNLSVANANVLFADRMQVANTISLVNASLANTNPRIVNLDSSGNQTAHFVPSSNSNYDLGSSTMRWRDLYVSNNSIDIDGTKIGTTSNGEVQITDSSGALKPIRSAEFSIGRGSSAIKMRGNGKKLSIKANGNSEETMAGNTHVMSVVNDRMQVANTVSLVNTKLANTNLYIASVSATERSALANTNLYIAGVQSDVDANEATERSALANTNSYIAAVSATERSALANTNTYIATKANLASPTLTGTPVAPTAANTTNTTQIATTAFVQTAIDLDIAALANSAPELLNTLDELAAALGDDANFATTLTTNLGQKLGSSASIALTGDVSGSGSFSSNSVSISVTVADDSHNHIIGNVDGLQSALNAKADDSITITAGNGLTGGGSIGSNRTINLDVNDLTTITPTSSDFIPIYDVSGSVTGKATITNAALQGAKGGTGSTGAKGTAGAKGGTGSTGAKGTAGAKGGTGSTGAKGNTGSTGAKGTAGAKGGTGSTGAKGNTGSTGAKGTAGAKGGTGSTGSTGAKGTAGAKGGTGSTGAKGNTGGTGGTGSTGAKGATGSTGGTGSKGQKGTTGSTGGTGGTGGTGAKGQKGDGGATGAAGPNSNDLRAGGTTTDRYWGNTHDYIFADASHGLSFYTSGAEEMRLEDDGDLHVDGDVIAYSTTVSDERLKEDITTVENAIEKIKQIRGVEFTRKRTGVKSAGVIAQELEKVLPQAVTNKTLPFEDDTETVYKTVDYDAIHALLIEAIKEQQVQIDELKAK